MKLNYCSISCGPSLISRSERLVLIVEELGHMDSGLFLIGGASASGNFRLASRAELPRGWVQQRLVLVAVGARAGVAGAGGLQPRPRVDGGRNVRHQVEAGRAALARLICAGGGPPWRGWAGDRWSISRDGAGMSPITLNTRLSSPCWTRHHRHSRHGRGLACQPRPGQRAAEVVHGNVQLHVNKVVAGQEQLVVEGASS